MNKEQKEMLNGIIENLKKAVNFANKFEEAMKPIIEKAKEFEELTEEILPCFCENELGFRSLKRRMLNDYIDKYSDLSFTMDDLEALKDTEPSDLELFKLIQASKNIRVDIVGNRLTAKEVANRLQKGIDILASLES